jgi:Mrp family chromosome partitioning ATPase
VVRTPAEERPSSHPPEKPARSYPPEVFDEPHEPEAPLPDEPELSYPRVPQFTSSSIGSHEGELVYPSLPPIERGTTGMLRPMPLPSFPGSSVPGNTPTGRATPSDEVYGTQGERPRTLRPPMPELSLDDAPPAPEAPMAPPTSIEVVVCKKPEDVDPNIVMLSDPYGDRADAFRALRRKLGSTTNPHVILVTSAGVGDGKTTMAINLAVCLREGIRGKVLLLEGNLRDPGLAKALGFEPPVCFDAQIKSHQEDPLAPWVAAELLPQFHVMAVDPKKEHEPIFDPIAFANGMTRLRGAGYEFIVVDSPPAIVDGTLFSAIRLKSKRGALREAMALILPSPILGVVMMDA